MLCDGFFNISWIFTDQVLLDVTPFCIVVLDYARVEKWYPSYIMAISIIVIAFFNTAIFIELTTIQNEKLNNEIYNNSWYLMDVKLQKMYLLLSSVAKNAILHHWRATPNWHRLIFDDFVIQSTHTLEWFDRKVCQVNKQETPVIFRLTYTVTTNVLHIQPHNIEFCLEKETTYLLLNNY